MNISKEIKIGSLVITSFVAIYGGLNFLKGKSAFDKKNTYYALYKHAGGLSTASPVTLNGCSVGKIRNIEIMPEEGHKVRITLLVDKKIQLTNTSVARLDTGNLLGGSVIDLLLKEGAALANHDTLLTENTPTLTNQVMQQVLPALQDAKSITLLTNQFMQNLVENTLRINSIFKNLENTSHQLNQIINKNQANFGLISNNIADISSMLSDKELGVYQLLMRLQTIMQSIEKMPIGDLSDRANQILAQVETGTIPHMNQALIDLDLLLADVKTNPARYVHFSVFGNNSIFRRPVHKKQPTVVSVEKASTEK